MGTEDFQGLVILTKNLVKFDLEWIGFSVKINTVRTKNSSNQVQAKKVLHHPSQISDQKK